MDVPRSEGAVERVLDMDDVVATNVLLTVDNDTNTTHVTTTSGHSDGTSVELDEVGDLASGEINLDGVVDLDGGVGVTNAGAGKRVSTREGRGDIPAISSKLDLITRWEKVVQPKLDPTAE